jgi:uncharacterized protein YegP (UPF0339 family)
VGHHWRFRLFRLAEASRKVLDMKIVVQKNIQGAWFWHLIAANGEILSSSQAYASKSNCKKTAKLVSVAGGFELVIE